MASQTPKGSLPRPPAVILFLVYAAFVALGVPDGMFGVAWPTMRSGFGVPIDAMGMALLFGTTGYLLCSFFAGRLIAKLSISGLLAFSCALAGCALIADCLVPAWIWFAVISLALGFGAGGIDAGLNTYVASSLSEREMHWLHACYGLGATCGPLIMTTALNLFGGWRPAYLALGFFQWALCAAYVLSRPAWKRFDKSGRGKGRNRKLTDYDTSLRQTLAHGPSWAGMLLFFLYSGVEVGLGFWAYTILTESRGVAPTLAGVLAGGFYGFFTVGRILSGIYVKHADSKRLLLGGLTLALFGSALLWLNLHPLLSFFGMILMGFVIAPVFPCLVSSTEQRVGRHHAGNTIGMQMAAAGVGAAVIPALMGVLARRVSVEAIPAAVMGLFTVILLLFIAMPRPGLTTGRRG